MELDRLSASILALAEFHGLCMAYDLCSENNSTLEEKFPVFKNENLMWIQPDMLHFLRNVSQNAQKFLYNLKPQEKALHQRFSKVRYKVLSNSRSPPYSNFVSSVIRVKWISNKTRRKRVTKVTLRPRVIYVFNRFSNVNKFLHEIFVKSYYYTK